VLSHEIEKSKELASTSIVAYRCCLAAIPQFDIVDATPLRVSRLARTPRVEISALRSTQRRGRDRPYLTDSFVSTVEAPRLADAFPHPIRQDFVIRNDCSFVTRVFNANDTRHRPARRERFLFNRNYSPCFPVAFAETIQQAAMLRDEHVPVLFAPLPACRGNY